MSELLLPPHSRPSVKGHVEPEQRLILDRSYPTDIENRVAAGAAGRAGDEPGTAAMGTVELGIFN